MEMGYSEDAGFYLQGTSVEVEVANSHEIQNVEHNILASLPFDVNYNGQSANQTDDSLTSFPSDVEFLEGETTDKYNDDVLTSRHFNVEQESTEEEEESSFLSLGTNVAEESMVGIDVSPFAYLLQDVRDNSLIDNYEVTLDLMPQDVELIEECHDDYSENSFSSLLCDPDESTTENDDEFSTSSSIGIEDESLDNDESPFAYVVRGVDGNSFDNNDEVTANWPSQDVGLREKGHDDNSSASFFRDPSTDIEEESSDENGEDFINLLPFDVEEESSVEREECSNTSSSQQIDDEDATVGYYSFLASLESYLDTVPQDVGSLEDETNRVIVEPTDPDIVYNFAWARDPLYVVNDRGHFSVRGSEHQVGPAVSFADRANELEVAAWVRRFTDNYDVEE